MGYTLGKLQIRRLLEGKTVKDGRGRIVVTDSNTKEVLRLIDSKDLYEQHRVIINNNGYLEVQRR